MRSGLVHSILEATPEATAARLASTPTDAALVEIRADALRASEIGGLVRRAPRPAIVAVRTVADGGRFDGSTEEKRAMYAAGLSGGAAFLDVEWDGPFRELAFGADAARTILSHHGARCDAAVLVPLFAEMAGTKAARLKIVPRASRPAEIVAARELLAQARHVKRDLCCFAMGAASTWSRVGALSWGSWGVYGSAARGAESGDGQLETRVMHEVYRVEAIGEHTRTFALCGTPVAGSPSPAMHAAGYRALGLDAVYVPLETDDLDDVLAIGAPPGPLAIEGLGVTIPLKVAASARCVRRDPFAESGAVNTVAMTPDGWHGWSTDAPAALALIRKHFEPAGRSVAILGAGGTARAVAAALVAAGAGVTLYSRDRARGEEAALAASAAWSPWDGVSRATWDVLVNATPLGRLGEEAVLRRHLNGRLVVDAAYGAEPTPLVRAASARGLAVADGFDFLEEQAALQFTHLTGREAPREAMAAALVPRRHRSFA